MNQYDRLLVPFHDLVYELTHSDVTIPLKRNNNLNKGPDHDAIVMIQTIRIGLPCAEYLSTIYERHKNCTPYLIIVFTAIQEAFLAKDKNNKTYSCWFDVLEPIIFQIVDQYLKDGEQLKLDQQKMSSYREFATHIFRMMILSGNKLNSNEEFEKVLRVAGDNDSMILARFHNQLNDIIAMMNNTVGLTYYSFYTYEIMYCIRTNVLYVINRFEEMKKKIEYEQTVKEAQTCLAQCQSNLDKQKQKVTTMEAEVNRAKIHLDCIVNKIPIPEESKYICNSLTCTNSSHRRWTKEEIDQRKSAFNQIVQDAFHTIIDKAETDQEKKDSKGTEGRGEEKEEEERKETSTEETLPVGEVHLLPRNSPKNVPREEPADLIIQV